MDAELDVAREIGQHVRLIGTKLQLAALDRRFSS
jgi:hypothetical protein